MTNMKTASRTINARIHRLAGQLAAVENMIVAKRQCADIFAQISAIRSGLDQVSALVFQAELRHIARRKTLSPNDIDQLIKKFSRTI